MGHKLAARRLKYGLQMRLVWPFFWPVQCFQKYHDERGVVLCHTMSCPTLSELSSSCYLPRATLVREALHAYELASSGQGTPVSAHWPKFLLLGGEQTQLIQAEPTCHVSSVARPGRLVRAMRMKAQRPANGRTIISTSDSPTCARALLTRAGGDTAAEPRPGLGWPYPPVTPNRENTATPEFLPGLLPWQGIAFQEEASLCDGDDEALGGTAHPGVGVRAEAQPSSLYLTCEGAELQGHSGELSVPRTAQPTTWNATAFRAGAEPLRCGQVLPGSSSAGYVGMKVRAPHSAPIQQTPWGEGLLWLACFCGYQDILASTCTQETHHSQQLLRQAPSRVSNICVTHNTATDTPAPVSHPPARV